MAIHHIDPLADPRWGEFLARHPRASAFHTAGWMRSLQNAYSYEPVVFTTTPPGAELANGVPFCRVNSLLTGRRLVSLPFSDHCEPLVDNPDEMVEILDALKKEKERNGLRYVELRPIGNSLETRGEPSLFQESESFCLHVADLSPPEDELLRTFHKSCVQRKIKRANRGELTFESGRSEKLLRDFYGLLAITRRRHGLPPQPMKWFRQLAGGLGEAMTIWLAYLENHPIASIVTLRFKETLTYKYGASDERYFKYGGTFALFWQAIREAKQSGALALDLGRSELDNQGLLEFKDHWGGKRAELRYWRFPRAQGKSDASHSKPMAAAKAVFARLPGPVLVLVGKALYRHKG